MLPIRTLLFPTDGSPCAEAARPLAERLARQYAADLHVLRVEVIPDPGHPRFDAEPPPPPPEWHAGGVAEVHRRSAVAGDAIVLYAEEASADLVVMGTHGRSGLDRIVLGSTAEYVLRRSPCPVLTVRPETASAGTGPVVVPLAFDSASDAALETAAALAEDEGVSLVAVHAIEPTAVPVPYALALPPVDPALLVARVEQTLRRWAAPYADRVPVEVEVRHGLAAAQIVDAARSRQAHLLVQASHGRRGVGRWLLGSVAEDVVRHAPCPVLTLRSGAEAWGLTPSESDLRPVPRADWAALFDVLSERAARAPHTVTLAVVSPEAEGALYHDVPLVGLTYDAHDDAVEVLVEGGGHHAVRPFAVRAEAGPWALDVARDAEARGPWRLEVVRGDGTRERVEVRPAVVGAP